MGKTLVIAEKPSVAREIAKALGITSPGSGRGRGGCIRGPEHIITWAVGHLVNIAEPKDQNPAWNGRWAVSQLPMIPGRFKLAVLDKTADQYTVVAALLTDPDVDQVLNATDAGREGELIFRRIYVLSGSDKPIRRLWASDMTARGLQKALAATMDGEDKRNLGLAAFARAEADWLVGMNFSRLFTVRHGELVTVGRVQTPVLKLLADRRREIEHFTPRDFWTVEARLQAQGAPGSGDGPVEFDALWHAPPKFVETRVHEEQEALDVVEACAGKEGSVRSVSARKRTSKPPLPFDLTTLQREANVRFGLSAKQTLGAAQSLYESRQLITYPRTDSAHLTADVFAEILDHLRAVYPLYPDITPLAAERVKKAQAGAKAPNKAFECVDDSKVTDHHAIIPTAKRCEIKLSGAEAHVYDLVCRRTIAAFMAPAEFRAATVWTDIAGQRFKATGKVFLDRGWLAAEPWRADADNPLPDVAKGAVVSALELNPKKGQTKPPPHYTDASLLAAMETAGKLVEDEAMRLAMKDRGLGTPATRAQTIETLVSRGYVDKKGKQLVCSDTGLRVVDHVGGHLPQLVSPELTGDWERRLKDIEAGAETYPRFMHDIRHMVADSVSRVLGRGHGGRGSRGPAPGRRDAPGGPSGPAVAGDR